MLFLWHNNFIRHTGRAQAIKKNIHLISAVTALQVLKESVFHTLCKYIPETVKSNPRYIKLTNVNMAELPAALHFSRKMQRWNK